MSNNLRNNYSLNNFEDLVKYINSIPMNEVADKLNLGFNKVGTSYKGNCPMGHTSHSGTCFSINTDTGNDDNYFYCFNCGKGGNNIELVKIALRLPFIEAVRWLVSSFNIQHSAQLGNQQIEKKSEEELKKESEFRLKAELYEEIFKWGHQELFTEKAKSELEYLTIKRGYDVELLRKTEFCYFPTQKEIREHLLGIYPDGIKLIRSLPLNGYFGDNFRLAIPYRNRFGQITGFLKRATEPKGITVTTKKDGKTHEEVRWDSTWGISKKDIFNLNNIKNKDNVLIVEGYPDALYLSALGMDNIVAVGQGKLSKKHFEGLKAKRVKEAIFALDNDKVGPNNTVVAVKMILKESDITPFVIDPKLLDPHKDPDEYVKEKGLGEFQKVVDKAVKGVGWLIDRIIKAGSESDLLKAKAKDELLDLSLILKDPEDISQLLEKISEFLSLTKTEVKNLIKKEKADYRSRKNQNTEGVFWSFEYNENNEPELKVSMKDYVDFIAKESFAKHYLDKEYIFINDKNNLVQEYSMPQIKDHILRFIDNLDEKTNPNKRELLEHLYRNVGKYFNEGLIECIPTKRITFKRDEPDKAYVYYRNGFVTLEKGKAFEFHGYETLSHPIWKDSIILRDYKPREDSSKVSEFEQFIKKVSGNDSQRFQSIRSALGYLMHDYKDKANTKAVILCDEKLSDSGSANGRTGKSLVGKALSYMKNSLRIDARNFKFKAQFTFQLVKLDTRIIDFNDAEGDFEFEKLFSVITDDMTIEYKNKQPFTIPFEESPKILISTNYTIRGIGSSYRDRMFEIEFSDHYSDECKPIDEFGHRLFDDWDEDEWARFDSFMLECMQLYLDKGLLAYEQINLAKRKLIDSTSSDFVDFAETSIEGNKEYNLSDLFAKFKKHIGHEIDPFEKCPVKQNTFSKWLKIYAEYTDSEFNKRASNGKQIVELKCKSQKVVEVSENLIDGFSLFFPS